jgi:hypothetical protein
MPSPQQVYPAVRACLQAMGIVSHRTAQAALASLLSALLIGQSLRPSVLARALPSPTLLPARSRYRRVARAWERPWLTAPQLSPALVRAALALAAPRGTAYLALDTLRAGAWEVFTIGLVWHGRVLPLGWAVLPYPWPKGRFTPTVCALVRQVAAVWPAAAPVPHRLADRAFPSRPLVQTLDRLGWHYTIRLRASDVVTLADGVVFGYDLIAAATVGRFTSQPGQFGRQATAGERTQVVVGRNLVVLPFHQRDAGSARPRTRRRAAKQHAVGPTRRPAPTEPWVLLLTTERRWWQALKAYGLRDHTEGTYRDAQGGWDGRHGWDLNERVAAAATARAGETVVGWWAVGTLLQSWVGDQLTAAATPAPIREVSGEWTVHGRLSVWGRGRLALTEPHGRLRGWVVACLQGAAERIQAVALAPPATAAPPLTLAEAA